MKVSLASALGTCFGVKDAIDLAMAPEFKSSLTIIGQLVHNPQVNESLNKNGVSLVNGIDEIDNGNWRICWPCGHRRKRFGGHRKARPAFT